MEFKIRGIQVEIDVRETRGGLGWTFSEGIFFVDEPSSRKAKQLPVLGGPSFYPTEEAAKTGARLWAESMIQQRLAP